MHAFITTVVAIVAAASFAMPAAAVDATAAPASGASLVSDIRPAGGSDPWDLTRVGDLVYFTANDGTHGRELWVTDGTTDGTQLVKDIRPGAAASSPRSLTRVGSRLYFSAHDGSHGRELWVSDGSPAGTKLVKDLTAGAKGTGIEGITDVDGTAYFDQDGRGLWRTDGTTRGTRLVRELMGVSAADTATKGATLFFTANGGIWKTNGTKAGTTRLSPRSVTAFGLTRFGPRIYFSAVPGSMTGLDTIPLLWRSDGTKAGTKQFGTAYAPTSMTALGGSLYFNAMKSTLKGARLYRSDGTAAGTGPVVPRARALSSMVREAGRLWSPYSGAPDFEPSELWASDGTSAGTALVHGGDRDWFTTEREHPGGLDCVGIGGIIYFAAGPGGPSHGWGSPDTELWSSDATTEGTMEASDINPAGSSMPRDLVKLGDAILFSATDGEHGRELWRFVP